MSDRFLCTPAGNKKEFYFDTLKELNAKLARRKIGSCEIECCDTDDNYVALFNEMAQYNGEALAVALLELVDEEGIEDDRVIAMIGILKNYGSGKISLDDLMHQSRNCSVFHGSSVKYVDYLLEELGGVSGITDNWEAYIDVPFIMQELGEDYDRSRGRARREIDENVAWDAVRRIGLNKIPRDWLNIDMMANDFTMDMIEVTVGRQHYLVTEG
jgi:hypothetical protein